MESAKSAQVDVTPVVAQAAPPVPTGLAGVAGDGQAVLSWNASAGAISYNLYMWIGNAPEGSSTTLVYSGPNLNFTKTGLTNGAVAHFRVTALN